MRTRFTLRVDITHRKPLDVGQQELAFRVGKHLTESMAERDPELLVSADLRADQSGLPGADSLSYIPTNGETVTVRTKHGHHYTGKVVRIWFAQDFPDVTFTPVITIREPADDGDEVSVWMPSIASITKEA